MMPMISSITLFLTILENRKISAITLMAPTKAAMSTAAKPVMLTLPAEMLPPSSSITRATPRPAPLLIPKMLGPASGLRKAVCSISPATASAPPQSMAVMACGSRDSNTINRQEALSPSSPSRIRSTSAAGILMDPSVRLRAKSTAIRMPSPTQ